MDFLSFFGRERFSPSIFQVGIAGFSLYAAVNETVNLKADAPTSVVEDGSSLNDHIINAPVTVSIDGIVGDVFRRESSVFNRVTPVSNTLGLITSFFPRFTAFQNQVVDKIQNTVSTAIGSINSILQAGNPLNAIVGNLDTASKTLQEQFIDAVENIYYGKQIIPLDVGGRRYESMVITSVTFTKSNVDTSISFKIEAQKFTLAQTTFIEVEKVARADKNPSSALGGQTKDAKQIGTQSGVKREQSFLSKYNPF